MTLRKPTESSMQMESSSTTDDQSTSDSHRATPEASGRLIVGIAGLGLFIYYAWEAYQMPLGEASMPGPGLFPLLVGIVGVFFSAAVIVDAVSRLRGAAMIELPSRRTALQLTGTVGLLTLYVFSIEPLGTYISSALFAVLSIKLLSSLPWWRAGIYGLAMALPCVFIFDELLGVSLPSLS